MADGPYLPRSPIISCSDSQPKGSKPPPPPTYLSQAPTLCPCYCPPLLYSLPRKPHTSARELYSGRPTIRIDTNSLRAGAALGQRHSTDTPDFRTLMCRLLHHKAPALSMDDVPTVSELETQLRIGSTATSLDELPRSILQHLPGHGVQAVHHLLHSLAQGHPSEFLNAVLHLPLRKKEPAWLLRNSRPVLLEPFMRRVEATTVPNAVVAPPGSAHGT